MTSPKAVYAAAHKALRRRQEDRDALIAMRKSSLYARYPRLQALDREMNSLAFRIFSEVSDGICTPDDIAKTLERETARIQGERAAILKEAGKEPDYFDPPFTCPKCKDTGFIGDEMCSCLVALLSEELFSRSHLSPKMRSQTFANMRFDLYSDAVHPQIDCSVREYMKNLRDICIDFTERFDSSHQNLLFYGASGLGKTYFSSAIANSLLDRGYSVLYESAADLFGVLQKKNFSNRPEDQAEYEEMHRALLRVDLLIIDDLGTEMINNFSVPELFGILNARLLAQKSTVINTNLEPADLKELYSERIASRLIGEFTPCRFVGDDLRLHAHA